MMKQNILPASPPKSKRKKELIKTDDSLKNLGSSPEGVDIYGVGGCGGGLVKNLVHKPKSSKRSHSSKSARSGTTSANP